MENQINIDFNEIKSLRNTMDKYGDIDYMVRGVNDNGEDQQIHISHDNIIVETFQENGWLRVNTYWYDGTCEETFNGRWNK